MTDVPIKKGNLDIEQFTEGRRYEETQEKLVFMQAKEKDLA